MKSFSDIRKEEKEKKTGRNDFNEKVVNEPSTFSNDRPYNYVYSLRFNRQMGPDSITWCFQIMS